MLDFECWILLTQNPKLKTQNYFQAWFVLSARNLL